MMHSLRGAAASLLALIALCALAGPVMAETTTVRVSKLDNGAKRMTYKVGPFNVIPGQNEISNRIITDKPKVDGWITRFRPDLTYKNGKVPGVDVIHLHHGVWVNLSRDNATNGLPELFFAAGEEKTISSFPEGFGYEYKASDTWLLNHMIHNLTPIPTEVYMVYEIDFIPADSRDARGIEPARPIWMDVQSGTLYPIFNVEKGDGDRGRFTYPNDDPDAYPDGNKRNEWVVDRDGVLVSTAGHLHPGGLHTDLWLRRDGARVKKARCARLSVAKARERCRRTSPSVRGETAHLFRSDAKYFEPAGAVSWDVAMTGTKERWRVKLRKGDVLSTTATYDSKRGSWWESMGIMIAYMADAETPGRNPFKERVDYKGTPTHGHYPENDNHGGNRTRLPDPRKLASGVENPASVDILGFNYQFGDLRLPGEAKLPPVVRAGQSLLFRNGDNPKRVYHSISSCKAPCNRSTGIAYPIADGEVQFESGTLGTNPPITTARSNEWRTPSNLNSGTYTYFCRIHPFMRGAFRVKK